MILLLSFALPVMAKEVLLKCDVTTENGKTYTHMMGFDEAAGTVTDDQKTYTVNTHHHTGHDILKIENHWYAYYINRTEFGGGYYSNEDGGKIEKEVSVAKVNRMDGSYSRGGSRGKCVPFKQAF